MLKSHLNIKPKTMKEESKPDLLSTEMRGPGLKASRYNNRTKFPLELQAEEPLKGTNPVLPVR